MPKRIAAIFLVACLAAANANAEEKKLVVVGGVDYAFKNLSLGAGGGTGIDGAAKHRQP